MGVSLTARTRRILWTAIAGVTTLLFVMMTSHRSVQSSSNIMIPDSSINSRLSEMNEELKIQIPGADKLKKELNNHKLGSGLSTKNLINGSDLVKDKNGNIDESKIMNTDDLSSNGPLVAGNPSSNKDINNKENINDSSEKTSSVKSDVEVKKNVKSTPKNSSTGEKKENSAKVSNPVTGAKKIDKSAAMKAQEKAERQGPSIDKGGSFNPKKEYENILSKNPVVIFSKSYCPFSKKLKTLLEKEYNISPPPMIVELDQHGNGKELQGHVGKETGRFTVPNFIVHGESKGGADDILALHENDELVDLFHSWSKGAAKIKKLGAEY